MRTEWHYGKAHQPGASSRTGGGIRLRTELLVSNQHLMIHMNKEDLVTQARGLRNQLTLDNDYHYE